MVIQKAYFSDSSGVLQFGHGSLLHSQHHRVLPPYRDLCRKGAQLLELSPSQHSLAEPYRCGSLLHGLLCVFHLKQVAVGREDGQCTVVFAAHVVYFSFPLASYVQVNRVIHAAHGCGFDSKLVSEWYRSQEKGGARLLLVKVIFLFYSFYSGKLLHVPIRCGSTR